MKRHKCNIGFVNPPYSQSDEGLHELAFVKHMMDCLEKNSIGIAIVPVSCALSPHPLREELLKHHTLDAVMTMPDDLFYPVGVVTCIMVFKAHTPHEESNLKTWFAYWKNDGFIKTKHKGRVDENHQWDDLRDRWVSEYRNRDDIAGECVKREVAASDEWCAEAYMETDYSTLTESDFEKEIKKYLVFNILNS